MSRDQDEQLENVAADNPFTRLLPYKYQSLETPRSFRLLQLRRHSFDGNERSFSGRLIYCDLDACPYFTALSYVWGDPADTVPLQCDGNIVNVTQNCYDALERLITGRCNPLVWVDAICIDQSSVQEKSVQVALMGDIYTTARHVMIWLGHGCPASQEGMQRLQRCAAVHRVATCRGPLRKWRMGLYMRYIEKGFDNTPGRHGTLRAGTIGQVLSNSWFERLWVLQEAALPSADRIALYCGSRRVCLDSVMRFAEFAVGWEYKIDHWNFARVSTHCAAVAIIANAKIGDRGPDNLFRLLNVVNQKRSSYAADYVYAIHGIATRNGLSPPMPDYSKPVAQIFTETARHCIESEKKLTILVMAGGDGGFALPSWVPDFSSSVWHSNTGDYRTTRLSKSSYQFNSTGLQLTVRGFLLDTVQVCGPAVPMVKGLTSPTFYSMKDNFAQVLQTVVPAWIKIAKDNYKRAADETMDHLRWTMSLEEPIEPADEPRMFEIDVLQYYFGQEREYSAAEAGERDFILSMIPKWWAGRRFSITRSGRMGLAPDRAEPGDFVALISGLRLPFIVRKTGIHFKLIGWSFIYGIMHGLAWPGEPALQDITLI